MTDDSEGDLEQKVRAVVREHVAPCKYGWVVSVVAVVAFVVGYLIK